jgi:5-methyltetrahydrofolate--homocysteine methyltransferase
VHDIGKSLVNTILTNNGYTVIDLGKQVPIGTIIEAAKEHDATAIGLSALLVSTSKQMPLCIQELHNEGLEFPVLLGGAAINRDFGLRVLYPGGRDSDEVYEPGVFYCKDAFEGLAKMDQIVDDEARAALVAKTREAAQRLRDKGPEPEQGDTDRRLVRSAASTDAPVPEPPFWGAREIDVPLDEVYHHLDTHVLFKLHWGGRGVKGDAWRKLVDEDFRPRLERMWREATTCTRGPSSATSPATARATRSSCSTPRTARRCSSASSSRASPSTTASAWPTSTVRRTAASSTSSRCRRSPPATRSPS